MQVQQQLSLLGDSGRTIQVPTAIHKALSAGFALAISVSGGKDSDAMARAIVRWFRQQGFPGRCYLIHAHLGRIEWAGVKTHLKALADALAVPLVCVKRGQGGLIEKWGERRASLERDGRAAPPWSSAACRFCTSDTKVAPINKHMRQHSGVVSAIGLRAEESSSRARKPFCQVRKGITGKAYLDTMAAGDSPEVQADRAVSAFLEDDSKTGRLALDWHSILDWSEESVWQEMGSSLQDLRVRRQLFKQGCYYQALCGFSGHWAYVAGASRLSCSQCVLAGTHDLKTGAFNNPATWLELALFELDCGWSFKQDLWLAFLGVDLDLAFERLDGLGQVLRALGLVRGCCWQVVLVLLRRVSPDAIALWQKDTLARLAQKIHGVNKKGLS